MNATRRSLRYLWLLGLVVLVGVAAGAGWIYKSATAFDCSPGLEAAEPRPTAGPGVVCFGYVDVPQGIRALYPAQPGRVKQVLVEEDAWVTAGTPLLRLDDRLPTLQLTEAEAALRAAETQLAEARRGALRKQVALAQHQAAVDAITHRLAAAQKLLDRKRRLERVKESALEEVEAAEEQVKEIEALLRGEQARRAEIELQRPEEAVERAEAEVAVLRARRDQAKVALEECVLKAPADGKVLRLLAGAGDLLGGPPGRPAVQFCPDGPRIIRAEVEQEFASRVAAGQAVTIHDDVRSGPTWKGRVQRVSDWFTQRRTVLPEPFQYNDVRTLECIIELEPDQPPLRINQRVRVMIHPAGS